MDLSVVRFLGAGGFFLVIFLSGFWLSRAGAPYNALVLAVHKLISLAAIVILGVIAYRTNQVARLGTVDALALAAAGLFFLGAVATGGMLSAEKAMPAIVRRLHQVTPCLTVLCSGIALYLLGSP